MRIAAHVTERVMHRWPESYWGEFVRKATALGHEVIAFSDEPNIRIDNRNPKLIDRTQLPDDVVAKELAACDVFVGPVLKYYRMAEEKGVRRIGILGPITKAEGVKATLPCAGCMESMEPRIDCYWSDEICMWHVTPNDILEVLKNGRQAQS